MINIFTLVSVFALCISLTACGLSPEDLAFQTQEAATAIAHRWTETPSPTSTLTPTATSTPTPSMTPTETLIPSPTPIIVIYPEAPTEPFVDWTLPGPDYRYGKFFDWVLFQYGFTPGASILVAYSNGEFHGTLNDLFDSLYNIDVNPSLGVLGSQYWGESTLEDMPNFPKSARIFRMCRGPCPEGDFLYVYTVCLGGLCADEENSEKITDYFKKLGAWNLCLIIEHTTYLGCGYSSGLYDEAIGSDYLGWLDNFLGGDDPWNPYCPNFDSDSPDYHIIGRKFFGLD